MENKLKNIPALNILVIGDVMLDHYVEGEINRMSAEAPIPIVNQTKEYNVMGGAANVAMNLSSLGAKPFLIGIVGNDINGKTIISELQSVFDNRVKLIDTDRRSTVKTRFVVNGKQIFRYDNEETKEISKSEETSVIGILNQILGSQQIDGVILQDYNKGIFTKTLIASILNICDKKKIPTFVDPKFGNYWEYKNVTVFKPNRKELFDALEENSEQNLKTKMQETLKSLNCDILLCTLAEDGVAAITNNNFFHEKADTFDIVDVSGAGDSTIAMITIAYLLGLNVSEILKLSNAAGKSSCLSQGVSAIKIEDIYVNIYPIQKKRCQ